MELVTGRSGEDHISSADIASMLRGVYNDVDVVLPIDDELSLTVLSANSAQVGKGGCMLQGHFARVETAEQLVIESGAPGYNRNDLIVARYTLGDDNIQAVYLAVIKGTAVAGDASDPSYAEGVIDDGDTLVEFPLWRIPITGVNVGDPERIMPTVDTLQDQISTLRDSVSNIVQSLAVTKGSIAKSGGWYEARRIGKLFFIVFAIETNATSGTLFVVDSSVTVTSASGTLVYGERQGRVEASWTNNLATSCTAAGWYSGVIIGTLQ